MVLKIFSGIPARIVAPSSDIFQICFFTGKGYSSVNKRCKPHLNRPTNADAISCWSSANKSPATLIGGGKIPFFEVLRAVNPHPWTDQGEICQEKTDSSLPNFTLIGATCRPCGAKNPKIGAWVKTIPAEAAIRADPAGKNCSLYACYRQHAVYKR